MNKNIKHIIAATLVIGAFSEVVPAGNGLNSFKGFGLGAVKAEAYTYKGAGSGELKSLNLYRGSGSELEIRSSYYGKEVDLTSKKDYYVELNGSDGVEIDAEVEGDDYVAKVFTSAAKDAKAYDIGDFIKVDSSSANIYIRTYKSEDDFKDARDDDNVTKCSKTYVIHVKKPDVNSDEELDAEDVLLKSIYLSDGDIDFSKKKTNYDVKVNEDVDDIVVRAKPDDDDYLVDINGDAVDEDGNYEKTVKLDKGNNEIKITVEGDDDKTTYTLNVYRGKLSSSDTVNNSASSDNNSSSILYSTGKYNTWQQVNGKWQYIDGIGQVMKNKWWFDSTSGNNYYLDENGFRKTGWLLNNNKWYYFDNDGVLQKDWKNINGKWYNLGKAGVMQIGWIQDSDKKWYFLDSNGVMRTGWTQMPNGSWYYLNENGEMLYNTTVDGYTLNKNGVMV